MTIKATRFTPETLISAPSRSAAVPNRDASLQLFSVSRYDFKDQKETTELRWRDEPAGRETIVDGSGKASSPVWLDLEQDTAREASFLYLKEREGEKDKGVTDLICAAKSSKNLRGTEYCVGTFPGPVSNLKVTKLGEDYYGIAVTGKSDPNGKLYNSHLAPKPKTTARLYSSLYVRHWDTYITPQRQSIFYAALMSHDNSDSSSHLFMTDLVNPLKGTGLESPMPPFGGTDHFDIGPAGLVFVGKDPDLSPALHTKCNIYVVHLSNYLETTPAIYTVDMGAFRGAMTSPRFSHDGTKVVFLAMREDGYEADRNEIFVMSDVDRPAWLTQYRASPLAKQRWDRSPSSVVWDYSGDALWVVAEHYGTKQIFHIDADSTIIDEPVLYPVTGSVSSLIPLPNGNVFASSSSFIDSSIWWYFDPASTPTLTPGTPSSSDPHWETSLRSSVDAALQAPIEPFSSFSQNGARFHLDPSQVSHGTIQADNANGYVHVFSVRPSFFDANEKYPVAFLIHGGPQAAWENAWSTRWNPAVFAEQGYIVVVPNPTGSTGYGQGLTDAIQDNWGGTPYSDIVTVFEFFQTLPHADTDRAVLLGASYGGYMANWIQGHPLGRHLRAIVSHDGVFSTMYELATDELYFVNHDLAGPWDPSHPRRRDSWLRWDPAQHTHHWSTPQLTIHSDNDFRLTMADGLAVFNTLQARGIPSEFLTFPDETHFVLGRENSLVWHEAVLSFINRHVGLPRWERRAGDLERVRMDGGETRTRAVAVLRAE